MAEKIEFNYLGTDYVLEYTRKTIRDMEARGFVINEIDTKPMTRIPQLWAGAFLCHHKREKEERINEIFNLMADRDELVKKLVEMYYSAMSTLIEEEEVDESKKIHW